MRQVVFGLLGAGLLSSAAYAADVVQEDVIPVEPQGLIFTGLIDVYVGGIFYSNVSGNADDDPGLQDSPLFGGHARVSIPFADRFSAQLDFDGEAVFQSTEDPAFNQYSSSFVGGVHLNWRSPETGLFGVFGGGGVASPQEDDTANLGFVGLEGQYYLGNTTFYGQLGYLGAEDETETDAFHDAWFVRGVARHYFTDFTMLEGELAYADGKQDQDGFHDMDILSWGLKVEHQFQTQPISAYLAYEGNRYDNTSGGGGDTGEFTEHALMAGLKFTFGPNSLLENDRRGATLDLPSFGRWVAAGTTVD